MAGLGSLGILPAPLRLENIIALGREDVNDRATLSLTGAAPFNAKRRDRPTPTTSPADPANPDIR